MKRPPYHGTVNIGLQKGYTGSYYSKGDYLHFVCEWHLKNGKSPLMLCAAVYEYDLVIGNHIEPHLTLRLVTLPNQKIRKKKFRKTVTKFARLMAHQFQQNRILVEFTDRSLLIEKTAEIDPKSQGSTLET